MAPDKRMVRRHVDERRKNFTIPSLGLSFSVPLGVPIPPSLRNVRDPDHAIKNPRIIILLLSHLRSTRKSRRNIPLSSLRSMGELQPLFYSGQQLESIARLIIAVTFLQESDTLG